MAGPVEISPPGNVGTVRDRLAGWIRTRTWIDGLELVGAAAVVALVLWPVTVHPGDRLAGTLDAPYHAWLGWRIGDLWRHGSLLNVTIPDAFAPVGFDLRLVDGLLPAWVTALWNLVTGGSLVLSYNLALATGVGLNLWAGRRLAQTLTSRRWVCFAAGVAFATAPALAGSMQAHLAFVYAFTLPLLLRQAILVARGEGPVAWERIAALFVLAYLCSAYHLVFGALAFVLVVVTWPDSAVWSKAVMARLGLAAAVAGLLLSPFVIARVGYERDERAAGSTDVVRSAESVAFSADLLGAVTPPESLWADVPVPRADLGPQLYAPLRPAFVGYVLLAGAMLLTFTRCPARRPLLVTAGALWALSLGPALHIAGHLVGDDGAGDAPQWLPYRALFAVPGLGALRAPTRASYALAAVLTAALAVALDAKLDQRAERLTAGRGGGLIRRGEPAVAGIIVVLLGLSITSPLPTSDLGISSATQTGLEELARRSPDGSDGILIVPWGCRLDDPRIVALQSIHRRPNVGCNPPPTATRWFSGLAPWAGSAELAALRCDPGHIDRRPVPFDPSVRLGGAAGVSRLRKDLGVRYVVIDAGQLPAAGCDSVRDAVATLARYETVSNDGTWTIVDLDRPQ